MLVQLLLHRNIFWCSVAIAGPPAHRTRVRQFRGGGHRFGSAAIARSVPPGGGEESSALCTSEAHG